MSEKKAEKVAPVHHGTIAPDATTKGVDWIRQVKLKKATPVPVETPSSDDSA